MTGTQEQFPFAGERPTNDGPQQYGKVRHDHPDTAKVAARRANITKGQKIVLDFLKMRDRVTITSPGATDEEMQLGIPMNPSTQRPRRIELVEAGLVEDSGERRKTRGGRSAIVWRVAS